MSLYALLLFYEVEAMSEFISIKVLSEELVDTDVSRKKSKRKNVLTIFLLLYDTYELSKANQVCPECGGPLHEMKANIRVGIEVILQKLKCISI